jgi:hypothetical protein
MSKIDKRAEILRQVELGKASQYGITGVKIELEGVLRRQSGRRRPACTNEDCSNGDVYNDDIDEYERCPTCHGMPDLDSEQWSNDSFCGQWLLRYLSQYDLAEKVEHQWKVKHPLVYLKFYTDPSVDSEVTATLSLKESENIFLLPKLLEAWNALGEAVGNGISTENAGMHMALLNHPDCYYSRGRDLSNRDAGRYNNFRKSMNLLMPALFFLGTGGDTTREMHFRMPRVSVDKYSAIHVSGDSLEFRVFDPCYDDPDQLLDNFVVMRNCTRFWRTNYMSPRLDKIASSIKFGNDKGDKLTRFYTSYNHIDILNAGLRKLKPAYRSIQELKTQRKFTVSRHEIRKGFKDAAHKAKIAYQEYEDRFNWSLMVKRSQYKAQLLEQRQYNLTPVELHNINTESVEAEIEAEVTNIIERDRSSKKSMERYVTEQLDILTNNLNQGGTTLTA